MILVFMVTSAVESQKCMDREDIALINGIRSSLTVLENKVGAKDALTCQGRVGWMEYKDHWYYISSERKTWFQAEIHCRNQGGYLVEITDSAENDWIVDKVKATFQNKFVWIGAARCGGNIWKWVNTWSELSYTSWGNRQPENITEECVALDYTDKHTWHNYPCERDMSFMCESQQQYACIPYPN